MSRIQPEHLAPCGLYCGACRIFQATQEDDRSFLVRLARITARRLPALSPLGPDALLCDGCLSTRRAAHCRECSIRACAEQRGLEGCHQCAAFPCRLVEEFPIPAGRKAMLRAVPCRRAHGTEESIHAEEARYRCRQCGAKLYRGAKRCPHCGGQVDVD
jgi:hypothetical protein